MRKIPAVLAAGLLIGVFAAAYADLPPPTPEEKAAAAAKAKKDAVEKAKAAKELAQAQDKAVANYKKNNAASASSGATAQPEPPQGSASASAPSARQPDAAELTRREAQTQMPTPGQANNHSIPGTVAKDKKNQGSSSAGASAQPVPPQSQGADHAGAKRPDGELTREEAQTKMPTPGQANDHSTTARDPQNSSGRQ